MEEAGKLIIGTEIDDKEFNDDLEDLIDDVEDAGGEAGEEFSDEFDKKQKVESILARVMGKLTGLGKGLSSVIISVIKAIAGAGVTIGAIVGIIGIIAGAVMIVAKAFEKVTSENQKIITNVKYLVWVIEQALQPAIDFVSKILEHIINIIIKIIGYTLTLLNMLSGGKLLKNAGADKFAESMKQGEDATEGMKKNLKDAKKQLAGFDEMNVLSDSSGGGSDAGIGASVPEFNMPTINFEEYQGKIQELIDKWYEFGNGIQTFFEETDFEDRFGNWGLAVEGVVEVVLGLWEILTGLGEMIVGLIKMVFGVLTLDMDLIKEGFDLLGQGIINVIVGIFHIIEGVIKTILGVIKGVLTTILDLFSIAVVWIYNNIIGPIGKFFSDLWNGVVNGVKGAWNGIKRFFSEGVQFVKNVIGQIWNKMIEFGSGVADGIAGAFKGIINSVLGWVEKTINKFLKAINSAIDFINTIPGVNISRLQMVSFPRLARGGIVNNVGPGVMMGSYIAGEKGPEAVIPLTDETMDRLGEAFARHTTINANIINSMNGKVISRELQRIQNDNDFAFNR